MNQFFGVKIASWNAQGGFRYKCGWLDGMLSLQVPNILLIQEQGTPSGTVGGTGFNLHERFLIGQECYECVLCEVDRTADNQRCTTSIMVETKFLPHVRRPDWMVLRVGRPVCYIDLASGVRIATIHAFAKDEVSIGEVRDVISWLDRDSPGRNWIFMGDFNSSPHDYDLQRSAIIPNVENRIQYHGSSTRDQIYCNVMADSAPTQGPGGVRGRYLDFAFISDGHYFAVNGITNQMVLDNFGAYVSDHNLVQLNVSI